jgi:hypothetical protein
MNFKYDKETEKLIVQESSRIEYHQLQLSLTRKVKGWKFHPLVKRGIWNGEVSCFDGGKINLGLWKECVKACQMAGTKFDMINKEDFPINRDITLEDLTEFCKNYFKGHQYQDKKTMEWKDFIPHDYQIETAFKILKNRYCIGEVATSGGKSLIISIIFFICSSMTHIIFSIIPFYIFIP